VASTLASGQSRSADEVKVPFPPGSQQRWKRDRAGKQDALLRAALRLFASKGYEGTTTREIAASAGCAEGLIHRYFSGKAGLLAALVEAHTASEVGDLRQSVRTAATPQEEFLQLVNWEVDRMWENRDFLRAFIPRAIVAPEVAALINQTVISVRTRAILSRLKNYRAFGKLPQEELEALAHSVGVIGMVFGFMRPLVLGHDRHAAREMAGVMARLLVRGCAVTA
jgi:TetR/AcrR family transcriptional regulator, regulator of cefoperazone and chloramphenicol sensitivity